MTDEDTPVTTTVLDNDSFAPGANVTAVTQGTHGTVTINPDNTVTYVPDPDYYGTDSYTYTVTTVAGNTETATVFVTVNSVTDAAADDFATTDEDTQVTTDVLANDSFEPGAMVTAVTPGSHGSVVIKADGRVDLHARPRLPRHRQLHLHGHHRRRQHRDAPRLR